MAFEKILSLDDLWSGEMRGLLVRNRKVLLIRQDDNVYAYQDRCPHLGVRLSEGTLEGDLLTCSAHQWQFSVRKGQGVNPQGACLEKYPVLLSAGDIYIDLLNPIQLEATWEK
jgi:toluene monooxygenase system ferredoxin subunit